MVTTSATCSDVLTYIRSSTNACWGTKPIVCHSDDKGKNDYAYNIGSVDQYIPVATDNNISVYGAVVTMDMHIGFIDLCKAVLILISVMLKDWFGENKILIKESY